MNWKVDFTGRILSRKIIGAVKIFRENNRGYSLLEIVNIVRFSSIRWGSCTEEQRLRWIENPHFNSEDAKNKLKEVGF